MLMEGARCYLPREGKGRGVARHALAMIDIAVIYGGTFITRYQWRIIRHWRLLPTR